MSLKGKIKVIDPASTGGLDGFVEKIKDAVGLATGTSIGTSPFADLVIEGIVQGDIKLQAVNDWKTTAYYGLTDAFKGWGAGAGGTAGVNAGVAKAETSGRFSINGASMLKFANTAMNVLGYTLGGTGPASKKMYGGSNLQGFNVQFKWYTPQMSGWREAISALCFLAWPSTALRDQSPGLETNQSPSEAQFEANEKAYTEIIGACQKHTQKTLDLAALINRMIAAGKALNKDEVLKIRDEINALCNSAKYTDMNQINNDYVSQYIAKKTGNVDDLDEVGYLESALTMVKKSQAVDEITKNTATNRANLQLQARDIGSNINNTTWYDLGSDNAPINPNAPILDNGGAKPEPVKEPSLIDDLPGGQLVSAVGTIASGVGDLLKGLADSFAKNPPKVCLEIYASNNRLKYRFDPLVITSFAITASRETIDGDPVIITMDIGFDYYQVNATNGYLTPDQTFAGAPIFKSRRME